MQKTLISILLLLFALKTQATTWNEPWADEVIKKSDYFVLAEVLSFDEVKGVKIKILKQIGGDKLTDEIEITNFYLLALTSRSSSHGPEFHFKDIKNCYFFIKKNSNGEYCIATPTSGFDYIEDGEVYANYRHSYHKAIVPVNVYEMSMSAIFNNYHQLNYNKNEIYNFINYNLSKKPSGFGEGEIKTFYLQHVSLELMYHLKLNDYYTLLIPFFNDDTNFHNRVSAARALTAYKTKECIDLLIQKIASNKEDDFTAVMCIWALKEIKPTYKKKDLKKLIDKASDEYTGFGGNIMDPRVGTDFPSVKSALKDLVNSL